MQQKLTQTNKLFSNLLIITVLVSLFAFSAFGAMFISPDGGARWMVNISGNNQTGIGITTLYGGTLLKFINGTVLFNVNVHLINASAPVTTNFTNITLRFNQTGATDVVFSQTNFTQPQFIWNISVDTTTITPDGNWSLNISAYDFRHNFHSNLTWYNLTNQTNGVATINENITLLIVDNTFPDPVVRRPWDDGFYTDTGNVNITVTTSEAYPSLVRIHLANASGGFANDSYYNFTLGAGTRALSVMYLLLDGNYTFNVTVNDTVNHVMTNRTRSFIVDTLNPVAALTASSGTTTTLGVAETMTCSLTDTNPANVTLTRTGASGVQCTGTSSCTKVFTSDSYDSPTFTCKVYDKAGRTHTKTFSFTRIDPPASGGTASGGGGGGSGASAATATSALGTVQADTTTTTTINTQEVREVTFTTNKKVDGAKVTVQTYTTKPASAPTAPEGLVFSYFEVNTVSFTNADVTKASIKFAVLKKWLEDNKLTTGDVVLQVYRDGAWKALKTSPASGDESKEYFVAETEGFSTFAITAQQKTAETASPSEETTEEQTPAESAAAAAKSGWGWIVILLVVVAIIVVYFVVKKRNR